MDPPKSRCTGSSWSLHRFGYRHRSCIRMICSGAETHHRCSCICMICSGAETHSEKPIFSVLQAIHFSQGTLRIHITSKFIPAVIISPGVYCILNLKVTMQSDPIIDSVSLSENDFISPTVSPGIVPNCSTPIRFMLMMRRLRNSAHSLGKSNEYSFINCDVNEQICKHCPLNWERSESMATVYIDAFMQCEWRNNCGTA